MSASSFLWVSSCHWQFLNFVWHRTSRVLLPLSDSFKTILAYFDFNPRQQNPRLLSRDEAIVIVPKAQSGYKDATDFSP